MPRIVWFVLNDGRSVVAGCDATTREGFQRALSEPDRELTLTSDDGVERLPAHSVRDFVFFDARSSVPAESAIYRFVRV